MAEAESSSFCHERKQSLVLKLFWKYLKFSALTAFSILLAYILETCCFYRDSYRDLKLIKWKQIQKAPVSEEAAFARRFTYLFQFASLDLLP